MPGSSNYTHIEVEKIKAETDSAFLVVYDGEEYWLPKSQIADAQDFQEGDVDVTMSISDWIASEKGIS